jgi:hypothetical protein
MGQGIAKGLIRMGRESGLWSVPILSGGIEVSVSGLTEEENPLMMKRLVLSPAPCRGHVQHGAG